MLDLRALLALRQLRALAACLPPFDRKRAHFGPSYFMQRKPRWDMPVSGVQTMRALAHLSPPLQEFAGFSIIHNSLCLKAFNEV
jgi:hypothetical protein